MATGALLSFLLQFRWFQIEVLQAMEKNVKLDEEYIEVSSQRKNAFYRFSYLALFCGNLLGPFTVLSTTVGYIDNEKIYLTLTYFQQSKIYK